MKISVRMFVGILIIGIALTIIGFTLSQSLFTDTEQSNLGQFVVGTLDLSVTGGNNSVAEPINVQNVGSAEDATGSKIWNIKNKGTLPGVLSIRIQDVVSKENGCNEPELLTDSSCGNPGENEGELASILILKMFLEGASTPVVETTLSPTSLMTVDQQWQHKAGVVTIPPGGELAFTLEWSLGSVQNNNILQSDSAGFDLEFNLTQATAQ